MPTIISWNTRGNYSARLSESYGKILGKDGNIILIQEAGKVDYPDETVFMQSFGSHNFYAFFCSHEDAKNPRCTTGLLVEDTFNTEEFFILESPKDVKAGQKKGRPIVCAKINFGEQSLVVATAHLTACQSVAKKELKTTDKILKTEFSETPNVDWIAMGDFNCDVNYLREQDIEGLFLSVPDTPTHESGKTYDFAMFSEDPGDSIEVTTACPNDETFIPPQSDHFPVYCKF